MYETKQENSTIHVKSEGSYLKKKKILILNYKMLDFFAFIFFFSSIARTCFIPHICNH